MKRILLLLLPLLAILSGCFKDMDPFEGGDGVRANINGYKCVMLGVPGMDYANNGSGSAGYILNSDISMIRIIDRHPFRMTFSIIAPSGISTGFEYPISKGSAFTATLIGPKEAPGEEIPLSGWIKFENEGTIATLVEARFELTGKDSRGQDYSIRHGFLRLYKNSNTGE